MFLKIFMDVYFTYSFAALLFRMLQGYNTGDGWTVFEFRSTTEEQFPSNILKLLAELISLQRMKMPAIFT